MGRGHKTPSPRRIVFPPFGAVAGVVIGPGPICKPTVSVNLNVAVCGPTRPDPAEQQVSRTRLGAYLSVSLRCFVSLSQAAGGEGFLGTLLIFAPQYPSPELQYPSEGNLQPPFL